MATGDGTGRPWRETIQARADDFYIMVGQCITAWADVDEALFQIFRDCVGPYEQSAIIFYRLPGLDPRLGLTDEIVRSILPRPDRKAGGHDHPDLARWKALRKEFLDLLPIRRRIAHHPVHVSVWESVPGNEDEATTYATGFEIFTGVHERLRESGSLFIDDYDKPPLVLGDLQSHLASVSGLTTSLRTFLREVIAKHPMWTVLCAPTTIPIQRSLCRELTDGWPLPRCDA